MSDVLYSKLRLEVPQALDGEDATITNSRGATKTVEMSSPITDIMLPGMEKYNIRARPNNIDSILGYGQIKKIPLMDEICLSLAITSMPSNTMQKSGAALNLSGLVVTATIDTPTGTVQRDVTSQCTFSPANGTTIPVPTNNQMTISVSYSGITTSFNLSIWDSRALTNNSWGIIAEYIKAGKFAQVASIGNTKTFTLNGRTYTAEVVAINDGTGTAASWYPANTVDFICEELYRTTYRYNSIDTNTGGFPSSEIKDTLNNTIYSLLPTALKNVIINKSHSYQSGYCYYSSGTYKWSSSMTTLGTKLWLPTYYEMVGGAYSQVTGETASNNKKYTLASKVKMLNGGTSAIEWWLGTPETSLPSLILITTKSGEHTYQKRANETVGVPICFRIG